MGLANKASNRNLALLLGAAVVAGTTLLFALPSLWPLSALGGTLSTIALWGLLAHRVETRHSRLLLLIQRLLVLFGTVLALGAGLAIFYAMLGPRWML
jgi:hypothetical protein